MPRGRKPKPTALKVVTGNPGKRPLNEHEPKPTEGAPRIPNHLSKEARAEWRRIVPELARLPELLRLVDRAALIAYCEAVAVHRQATREIQVRGLVMPVERPRFSRNGELLTTDVVYMENPAVKIQSAAAKTIQNFCAEFGLTPSSRTRINIKPKKQGTSGLLAPVRVRTPDVG